MPPRTIRAASQLANKLLDPKTENVVDTALQLVKLVLDGALSKQLLEESLAGQPNGILPSMIKAISIIRTAGSPQTQAVVAGLFAFVFYGLSRRLVALELLQQQFRALNASCGKDLSQIFKAQLVTDLLQMGVLNPHAAEPFDKAYDLPYLRRDLPGHLCPASASCSELDDIARSFWTPRAITITFITRLTGLQGTDDKQRQWMNAIRMEDSLTPEVVKWVLSCYATHHGDVRLVRFLLQAGLATSQVIEDKMVASGMLEQSLCEAANSIARDLASKQNLDLVADALDALAVLLAHLQNNTEVASTQQQETSHQRMLRTAPYIAAPLLLTTDIAIKFVAENPQWFPELVPEGTNPQRGSGAPEALSGAKAEMVTALLPKLISAVRDIVYETKAGRDAVGERLQPLDWLELAATKIPSLVGVTSMCVLVCHRPGMVGEILGKCKERLEQLISLSCKITDEMRAREAAGKLTAIARMMDPEDELSKVCQKAQSYGTLMATCYLMGGTPCSPELFRVLMRCCEQTIRDSEIEQRILVHMMPLVGADDEAKARFFHIFPRMIQAASLLPVMRAAIGTITCLRDLQNSPPTHLTRPQVLALSKRCIWDIGRVIEEAPSKWERVTEQQLWDHVSKVTEHKMSGEQLGRLHRTMKDTTEAPVIEVSMGAGAPYNKQLLRPEEILECIARLDPSPEQLHHLMLNGLDRILEQNILDCSIPEQRTDVENIMEQSFRAQSIKEQSSKEEGAADQPANPKQPKGVREMLLVFGILSPYILSSGLDQCGDPRTVTGALLLRLSLDNLLSHAVMMAYRTPSYLPYALPFVHAAVLNWPTTHVAAALLANSHLQVEGSRSNMVEHVVSAHQHMCPFDIQETAAMLVDDMGKIQERLREHPAIMLEPAGGSCPEAVGREGQADTLVRVCVERGEDRWITSVHVDLDQPADYHCRLSNKEVFMLKAGLEAQVVEAEGVEAEGAFCSASGNVTCDSPLSGSGISSENGGSGSGQSSSQSSGRCLTKLANSMAEVSISTRSEDVGRQASEVCAPGSSQGASGGASHPKACPVCGTYKDEMYLCSGCKSVRYCSPDCQRQHWRTHRRQCIGQHLQEAK